LSYPWRDKDEQEAVTAVLKNMKRDQCRSILKAVSLNLGMEGCFEFLNSSGLSRETFIKEVIIDALVTK
jgi:hypothetical protein